MLQSRTGFGLAKVWKRFVSNSYTYTHLPESTKLDFKASCECFAKELNAGLPESSKLDLSLEVPSGSNPQYHKHVLLLSESADAWKKWPSKLELSTKYPDNALGPLKEYLKDTKEGNGILLNEIALEKEHSSDSKLRFLVVPNMKIYELTPGELEDFALFLGHGKIAKTDKVTFEDYLKDRGTDTGSKLSVGPEKTVRCQHNGDGLDFPYFEGTPYHKDMVLVCGHYNRDQRCGALAPMLKRELSEIKPDLKVGMISHIGGHKFAGNLVYYKFNGLNEEGLGKVDGIWLSKVLPQHLQVIINNLDKRVIIRDFFRGKVSNYK